MSTPNIHSINTSTQEVPIWTCYHCKEISESCCHCICWNCQYGDDNKILCAPCEWIERCIICEWQITIGENGWTCSNTNCIKNIFRFRSDYPIEVPILGGIKMILPIEYKGNVKKKHIFFDCWCGHYHSTNDPNNMFE